LGDLIEKRPLAPTGVMVGVSYDEERALDGQGILKNRMRKG
jgi:hypothetical protein